MTGAAIRRASAVLAMALMAGAPAALLATAGPGLAQVSGAQVASISGFAQAVAEASADDPALAAFYAGRAYAPIWTTGADAARRQALMTALASAPAQGLPDFGAAALAARFAEVRTERERGLLEVAVSRSWLGYAQAVSAGVIAEPKKIDPGLAREVVRRDGLTLLTGFAEAENPSAYLQALAPQAPAYAMLLKARLDIGRQIAKGGWGPQVGAKRLAPGDTGPAVVALRDRLQAMGYLGRSATASYDGEMQKAVQNFQFAMGFKADGVAGEATLREINRAPEERLKSILVALERLRWMNGLEMGRRHVWVNIPDFTVRIFDDGKLTFESVTVVGMNQSDRRTPEFSDVMEMMVINPSWSVPRSITVKEYLPMMQRNANAAGHIQLIDSRGRAVPRSAVNFAAYNAKNFPFAMRQPPSGGNALGLVKFLFPNPHNIYLHDTPSKSLFAKEVRAFSHGCIRVGRPFDLAYALLARQEAEPEAYFKSVLNTGAETTVRLAEPVPVHLVYFTAYPDARGAIEYRADVYGRDAALFGALQKAGVELTAPVN